MIFIIFHQIFISVTNSILTIYKKEQPPFIKTEAVNFAIESKNANHRDRLSKTHTLQPQTASKQNPKKEYINYINPQSLMRLFTT